MKLCDLLTAKILNSYKNIIVLQKDKNSAAGGIILEVEKDKQKEKCCYYGIYSLSMCGIFCIILFIFMKNGKSFIHKGDGMQQHYIALEYWGNYLRQIIRDLVFAHRLNIPQWRPAESAGCACSFQIHGISLCISVFSEILSGGYYILHVLFL